MLKHKNFFLSILFFFGAIGYCSAYADYNFSSDTYRYNPLSGEMDIYHAAEEGLSDANTNFILINSSGNFVWNGSTYQIGAQFNVFSGVVQDSFTATHGIFDHITIGSATIYNIETTTGIVRAATGDFGEIYTSTIHPNSPLDINLGAGNVFTFDVIGSTPMLIIPPDADIVYQQGSQYISVLGAEVINVSTGNFNTINVSSGGIYLSNSDIEMNGGSQWYDEDKNTRTYYDEATKELRTELDGTLIFLLEEE